MALLQSAPAWFGRPGSAGRLIRWALLAGCLLAVVTPRFNLRDPGIIGRFTAGARATPYGVPIDVAGYIRLADYFRGEAPADSMIAPFCFRPLVPLTASLIPVRSQTGINLIDVACLLLTLFVLDRILRLVGFHERARTIGSLMFIVSFPTFYYGAIGFVDPPSLLLFALGALWSLKRDHRGVTAAVVLGVLVKETNGLIALLPALSAMASGRVDRSVWWRAAGLLSLASAIAVGIRVVSPFPDSQFMWWPRLESVLENLSRPRTYLSLFLTLGVPGVLAAASVAAGRARSGLDPHRLGFFLGGCFLASALYAYTLWGAYSDGRIIWIIYPFAIPVALTWFESPVKRMR